MNTSTFKRIGLLFLLVFATSFALFAQGFKISPSGTAVLCSGDTLVLEASSGFAKYQWNTKSTSRIIRVTTAGTYICTAADKGGKTYRDTVKVQVVKGIEPTFQVNPKTREVCSGDSLTVEVTNKFRSYKWSTGDKGNSIVIYPKSSGAITLITIDSNGCTNESKIQYTVKTCGSTSCKDLIGAWPDKLLCGEKDSVLLEAKSGFTSYLWDNGSTSRIRTIKKAGTYTLKAKDAKGNTCYDTIVIKASAKKLSITTIPSNTEICKGDSIKLLASTGFKSYGWSTKQTNRWIYVKPTQTMGYLVEAVDDIGCEYKEDIRITVKNCDSCTDLIGTGKKKTLCSENDSVWLEAKSGFKTYKWSNGESGRVLKVKKKGWYVLTATSQTGKVCKDSIYIDQGGKALKLFSNPNPAIVCPGDKVVVEASGGFVTYWWNTGNKGDRAEFYPQSTKTIVVEAEDSVGCEVRTELKIIVKDTCKKKCPEIIEPWPKKVLCKKGDSIVLEAKNGYNNYKWSTGKTGRVQWVTTSGWYWLDFKDANGNTCRDSIYIGQGSTKKIEITLYPKGPFCPGDSVLAVSTRGFAKYWWSKGPDGYPLTGFVFTKEEKLVVEALDSNGCEARAEVLLKKDSCKNSSVLNRSKSTIRMYPNPANSMVTISSDDAFERVTIYDVNGKAIRNIDTSTPEVTIDIELLESGMYLIRVSNKETTTYLRLVKE